jgi:hypothetical protein
MAISKASPRSSERTLPSRALPLLCAIVDYPGQPIVHSADI